jgi:O-antigen/teichoic acid export membrane protein
MSSMPRPTGAIRGTATILVTYLGTAGLTAVLTLYLVRALGTTEYGIFALAMSVSGLMALAMDFGIGPSLGRFMAERVDDPPALAGIFAGALRLKLALGGVVVVALLVLAGPIARAYDAPDLEWPLRWLAVATLLQSVVLQVSSAFFAIDRSDVNLRMILAESVVELAASVVLVVAGGGAAGAAFGRVAGYAVGAAIGLVLTLRLLGRAAVAVHRRGGPRAASMSRYAAWLWLVGGAFTLFSTVDVLIIGAILGPTAVGAFSAPMRLVAVLTYPALALSNSVTPRLARSEAGNAEALVAALRWLLVFQPVIAVPLVVWAEPITSLLLGDGYGASVGVMRAMAPFVYLHGIAALLSLAANYLGDASRRLPWAVGTVLINVALDVATSPSSRREGWWSPPPPPASPSPCTRSAIC